jgi:hypothetical protein
MIWVGHGYLEIGCIGTFVCNSLLGGSWISSLFHNSPNLIHRYSALGSVELFHQSHIRGGSSSSTRQTVMTNSWEFKGISILVCVMFSLMVSMQVMRNLLLRRYLLLHYASSICGRWKRRVKLCLGIHALVLMRVGRVGWGASWKGREREVCLVHEFLPT